MNSLDIQGTQGKYYFQNGNSNSSNNFRQFEIKIGNKQIAIRDYNHSTHYQGEDWYCTNRILECSGQLLCIGQRYQANIKGKIEYQEEFSGSNYVDIEGLLVLTKKGSEIIIEQFKTDSNQIYLKWYPLKGMKTHKIS